MLDIKKAREICEAATQGPWEANKYGQYVISQHKDKNVYCDDDNVGAFGGCLVGESMHKANAEFIAYSRTALPAALNEIERMHKENANSENTITQLRKENEYLRTRLSYIDHHGNSPSKMDDNYEELERHLTQRGKRY